MIYLTGDIHGNIDRIIKFCNNNNTSIDDILIILGDAGFNFFLNYRNDVLKHTANKLPITLFCIRGNHEARPQSLKSYTTEMFHGDTVYYEKEYPNIKFAIDGGIYDFDGFRCLTIGGAYSVDKYYRLRSNAIWFANEQLSNKEMCDINGYILVDNEYDYVFTHTCPYDTRPTHLFLNGIDQLTVDTSMEEWLQFVADCIKFKKWYFGHFHDNWENGKYKMLYDDIIILGE